MSTKCPTNSFLPFFLQPLIDTNSAYFKCFVAEEKSSGALIGYVLFFHTLDADRAAMSSLGHGHSAIAEAEGQGGRLHGSICGFCGISTSNSNAGGLWVTEE